MTSHLYPADAESEAIRAAELKTQLLKYLRLPAWPDGQEPEISFPRLQAVGDKQLVDIKLKRFEHHDRLSRPNVACRFEHNWFDVDRTGGFVDPKKWLILQFAHPILVKLDGEDLDDDDIREINFYVKDVMRDLLDSRCMEQFDCSRPLAIWLLKDGYPHSKEKLDSETGKMECEKRPTFVILLEKKMPISRDQARARKGKGKESTTLPLDRTSSAIHRRRGRLAVGPRPSKQLVDQTLVGW